MSASKLNIGKLANVVVLELAKASEFTSLPVRALASDEKSPHQLAYFSKQFLTLFVSSIIHFILFRTNVCVEILMANRSEKLSANE